MSETGTCEYRDLNEDRTCPHPEVFLVQAGTRKADAQRSCAVHLARTCRAMSQDGGLGVSRKPLTVTMTGMF